MHFWRFLRLGAARAGSSTACSSRSSTPWLFDELYPWLTRDMTVERTAFVDPRCAATWSSARCSSSATWSSTTRASASSSRIATAPSARSSPARGSCARHPATLRLYLLNGACFMLARARLRAGRARRALRPRDLARAGPRPALHPAAALREAAVLCLADRVLPRRARACRLHRRAAGRLARVARRRIDRECVDGSGSTRARGSRLRLGRLPDLVGDSNADLPSPSPGPSP